MTSRPRGFSAVEALLILVVLTIVVGVGWTVLHGRPSRPKTIDDVLSGLTAEASKTYGNFFFEPDYKLSRVALATSFNTVPGYNFKVSGSVGKGIWTAFESADKTKTVDYLWLFHRTLPPAKSIDDVKSWVGSRLVTYGFTTSDHKTYHRDGNTCTVLNDPAKLSGSEGYMASNIINVSCFGPDVLHSAAAQMKPFVEQYVAANPDANAHDLAVGPLTIKSKDDSGVISSSHAAGYDIAEMIVSTKDKKQIALYYAKGSDWHYVTRADDEFGFRCGPMQSDAEARKALYNQICLSGHGQVRLDTSNRALQ